MDPILIQIIIVSAFSVSIISLIFFTLHLRKEILQLKRFNAKLVSRLSSLIKDVQTVSSASYNIAQQINKVSDQVHHLDIRQDELDLKEQTDKPIEQAIALVEKGADLEEIMQNCNLSRGEAELLMHIHSD